MSCHRCHTLPMPWNRHHHHNAADRRNYQIQGEVGRYRRYETVPVKLTESAEQVGPSVGPRVKGGGGQGCTGELGTSSR